MAVLAAHAHPEGEAAGRLLGERGDLSGHGDRVAQRQQVDADVDADRGMEACQPRHGHEAVSSPSTVEGDVVGGDQVVQAGLGR